MDRRYNNLYLSNFLVLVYNYLETVALNVVLIIIYINLKSLTNTFHIISSHLVNQTKMAQELSDSDTKRTFKYQQHIWQHFIHQSYLW